MYREDCPKFTGSQKERISALETLTREQRAWAAGFFDGEGCVWIQIQYKYGKEKLPCMALKVEASGCDRRPIDALYSMFKGAHRCILKSYQKGRRSVYNWRTSGWPAYDFCRTIVEYSTVKREQLELAIRFYELPWRNRGYGPSIKRTPQQLLADVELSENVSLLKKWDGDGLPPKFVRDKNYGK